MAKAHLSARSPPGRDFVKRATLVMAVGNDTNRTASGVWRLAAGGSARPATGGGSMQHTACHPCPAACDRAKHLDARRQDDNVEDNGRKAWAATITYDVYDDGQ